VEYSVEDLASLIGEDEDLPTEAVRCFTGEPAVPVWLSNRYLAAVVGSTNLIRGRSLFEPTTIDPRRVLEPTDGEDKQRNLQGLRLEFPRAFRWEFRNQSELQQVLNEMVEQILTDGLEYFELEVAETRRFHEKLEVRRLAEQKRRADHTTNL
jgi:hypothetical protein